MAKLTRSFDWSNTGLGDPDQWPVSLRITLANMLHSAFPMFLFWGPDLTCFYNDAYRPSLGSNGKHPAVGLPAREVWVEIWGFIGPLITKVMSTGQPEWFEDQLVPIYRNGQMEDVYWTFSYSPAYGDEGTIEGMMVTCTETTQKVKQFREMRESRELFRTLIEEASVATCLFVGQSMKIEIANDKMISFWGKDRTVIGKPLMEAVPELEGQPFLDILDQVYTSGESFHAFEAPAQLKVNGVLSEYYFDFTYTPVRDAAGNIYGVMDMATDVTEQVKARQMLLISERNLRNLVLQAPVAICIFKGEKHVVEIANDRMIELWGRPALDVLQRPIFEGLPEARNQGFEQILQDVLVTGKTFRAADQPLQLPRNGQIETIYLNFVYEPYREKDDSISGIIAVASDVTDQVVARHQIEQVVKERTHDLAIRSNELSAANDELLQSNAELAQFAYVASHDLQEPLRKVINYSGRLQEMLPETFSESHRFLNKINHSAMRMRNLIQDVLAISEVSRSPDLFVPVDLSITVSEILEDFELLINESKAKISLGKLPVIDAMPLEMRQLFSNLVGNALKFNRQEVGLAINIECREEKAEQLLQWEEFKMREFARYVVISVRDNGIGFEQHFAKKIFEIFQRLHSRDKYGGTGIGLALCQKIVHHHHGSIRAQSLINHGSVFEVLLPIHQSEPNGH